MTYTTTLPRKPIATGSESHVGRTACENPPKLITGDFDLIRAASLGLICMTDDLINRCAPLSGTEILETLDQMELLLGLIRHEVRSRL
ncbi:Riboflavin kinase [Fusarium oxysporum f. sp. albedinis]|nr:Riboflavin kinase [Fusarium oxysporum f. sp. albedinis]